MGEFLEKLSFPILLLMGLVTSGGFGFFLGYMYKHYDRPTPMDIFDGSDPLNRNKLVIHICSMYSSLVCNMMKKLNKCKGGA